MTLARRLAAEGIGTALLLATVVGSGIMGERLAGGNVPVTLLANSLATGTVLVALILTFGPVSGAHLNPAVTLTDAWQGGLRWPEAGRYVLVQGFTGIRPADVPGFLVAQLLGAATATTLFRWLVPALSPDASPAGERDVGPLATPDRP